MFNFPSLYKCLPHARTHARTLLTTFWLFFFFLVKIRSTFNSSVDRVLATEGGRLSQKTCSSVVRSLRLVLEVPGSIPARGEENFGVRTRFL